MPGLEEVLERFAADPAGLFAGNLGDAIRAAVRSRGGVLERDELDSAQPCWTAAARAPGDGPALWATPSPTHAASDGTSGRKWST
jgi:gamma-glutamyltranspeptidase / glutathione hydrolase